MCPPLDASGRPPLSKPALIVSRGPCLPRDRVGLGRRAESLASDYLADRGYKIVTRNHREGPREIDLIAEKDGWIVMVEVRFRSDTGRGRPEETVRFRKRRHLLRAGRAYWLRLGRRDLRLRFDLISISLSVNELQIRHFPYFLRP